MLKRLLTILTIGLFFSCGDDVVEIIDVPIPNEPQEIFEVNVVGYSTDEDHNFVEDVNLTFGSSLLNTDSTSFFVQNKVLIGKEGSVIKAEKDGYLPIFKRVYHHRSLEDLITNITMYESPSSQIIDENGGNIQSLDGSILSFDANSIDQTSDIIFYSSFATSNQIDFDPFILEEDKVNILNKQALFFVGAPYDLKENATISILINGDKFSSLENMNLYRYNESNLTWELSNMKAELQNGEFVLNLDSFGWWALGSELECIYGAIQLNQEDGSPLRDSEIVFSKLESSHISEHLFTNAKGEINKYFSITEDLTVLLDNGEIEVLIDNDFSSVNKKYVHQIDQKIVDQITAEIYNCDLNKQDGFVSIVTENQYVIKRINDGEVDLYSSVSDQNLELRFYNNDEDLLTTKIIETENIPGNLLNFVACNPVLLVEKDNSIVQDFNQCKVRVKPIESFIVGEESDDNLFFIAFKGDQVGTYDGLVYASDLTSFTVADIEKEVTVDIMIYDKTTSTIAGFVDGKYKNGELFKISFIGNVEE